MPWRTINLPSQTALGTSYLFFHKCGGISKHRHVTQKVMWIWAVGKTQLMSFVFNRVRVGVCQSTNTLYNDLSALGLWCSVEYCSCWIEGHSRRLIVCMLPLDFFQSWRLNCYDNQKLLLRFYLELSHYFCQSSPPFWVRSASRHGRHGSWSWKDFNYHPVWSPTNWQNLLLPAQGVWK